jgi:hypothetical protein
MTVRFFHPKVHTGWHKDMPMRKRRALVLKKHKNNALAAGRSMQALANITTDKQTRIKSTQDAKYFYRLNKKRK